MVSSARAPTPVSKTAGASAAANRTPTPRIPPTSQIPLSGKRASIVPPVPTIPRGYSTSKVAGPATKLPKSSSLSNRFARTDNPIPGPSRLYSTPTIAKSTLTASVSAADISQPTPKMVGSRLSKVLPKGNSSPGSTPLGGSTRGLSTSATIHEMREPRKPPSRIPTPVGHRARGIPISSTGNAFSKSSGPSPRRYRPGQFSSKITDAALATDSMNPQTTKPSQPTLKRSFIGLKKTSSKPQLTKSRISLPVDPRHVSGASLDPIIHTALEEDSKAPNTETYQKHVDKIPHRERPFYMAANSSRSSKIFIPMTDAGDSGLSIIDMDASFATQQTGVPDTDTSQFSKPVRKSQRSIFNLHKTPSNNFSPVLPEHALKVQDRRNTLQSSRVIPAVVDFESSFIGQKSTLPDIESGHVWSTPKRRRSRFLLGKSPAKVATSVESANDDKKPEGYKVSEDTSTSTAPHITFNDSFVSQKSKAPAPENSHIKSTPRHQRSFFGLGKTPTNITTPVSSKNTRIRVKVSSNTPTPSRAPTKKGHGKQKGQSSTPPLQKQQDPQQKENVPPAVAHRLLGPVSPSRTRPHKSRTLGMLSNLTASFSRSTMGLGQSRNTSTGSLLRSEPTTYVTDLQATRELLKPSHRQVLEPQENQYWCGRVQGLVDSFQKDDLDEALKNPKSYGVFRSHVNIPKPQDFDAEARKATGLEEHEPLTAGIKHLNDMEALRYRRAFIQLWGLCLTPDAKQSLQAFQQKFARIKKKAYLLPRGGTMEDKIETSGWVERLTNAMRTDSSSISGASTSLSRRMASVSTFGRSHRGKND